MNESLDHGSEHAVVDRRLPARRAIANAFVAIAVVNALGLWVVLSAARVHWMLDVLTSFTAYSAVLGLTGVIGAWTSTSRRTRWLGIIAFLSAVLPTLQVTGWGHRDSGIPRLKVVCFNVFTGNRDEAAVQRFLTDEDPDLFVLLEADEFWSAAASELDQQWPHALAIPRGDNFGIVVHSKYEFADAAKLYLDDAGVPTVSVALAIDEATTIRVLATHPLPPIGQQNWRLRNQHLAALADLCRDEDEPLIVVGDLNVTPWSPFYRGLVADGDLTDARQSAVGLATTWNAQSPLFQIPIDHAFVKRLEVTEFRVGHAAGSDHFPVILTVAAIDG